MKTSLLVGRFAGIPLKIHWSFSLIFLYVFYISVDEGLDYAGISFISLLILSVFVCVILHEYGHALTARRYGVQTKDILVTPIGGIARLMKMPDKPIQEVWIALAGPAVNVVIALLLAIALWITGLPQNLDIDLLDQMAWQDMTKLFMTTLLMMNGILVIFNMLPAFPMDGGRVLRALISMRYSKKRATQIASYLGQIISIVFIGIGFWKNNYSLGFIGFFVFVAARGEYRSLLMELKLKELKAKDVMKTDFNRFYFRDPMKDIIEAYDQKRGKHFIILDDEEKAIGLITEQLILRAKERNDILSPASEYLYPSTERLTPQTSIQAIINRFRADKLFLLPVFQGEYLVGLIDRDDIQRALMGKA